MRFEGIHLGNATTPYAASLRIDAKLDPLKLFGKLRRALEKSKSSEELDAAKRDIQLVRDLLADEYLRPLFDVGIRKRAELGESGVDTIPK